jgi:hypothetical protein
VIGAPREVKQHRGARDGEQSCTAVKATEIKSALTI